MTFYREYDSGLSAILLALMTGAGTAIAWLVTMVTFSHSLEDVLVMAVIGALGLLWRLVLLTPALAVCVWLLRKFRRWFAPDTATDAR